ncbi:hypothetical protein D3C76_1556820 [compost metagenome]
MEGKTFEEAARDVTPQPQAQAEPDALPSYPDDVLEQNIIKWQPLIDAKRTSPEHLIATIRSKYTLSDAQAEKITNLKALDGDAA